MPVSLPTIVENVEEFDDYTIVKVRRKEGAMLPVEVQKMRARARAMVAAGVVDVTKGRVEDIASAVRNLDPSRIRKVTDVQRETGRELFIRVNT